MVDDAERHILESGTKRGRRSADEVRRGRIAEWLRPPGCQQKVG
jgi:hypothetical protein